MLVLLAILCLLLAPPYLVYRPPSLVITLFQHRWPGVLWRVSTSRKLIALTIDDAPSEYTSRIVQLLHDNDAHATFFVIGSQVPGREAILEDIIRNGNELGNHAMHDEPSRSLTDAELTQQIEAVQANIDKAYGAVDAGSPPHYFRPGSGFFSTRMRELLDKLHYKLVLGSIYPHDPQISFWRLNAAHILSRLRRGGIIICHDRRSWTLPMLQRVLPEVRRRGYRLVTVTELLEAEAEQ